MLRRRSAGVLLHPTSLPSPHGLGDTGPDARRFVDFLHRARQNYWQVLPLNYTDAAAGFSPYTCFSAFAGNHWLISPELLRREGLLTRDEIASPPRFPAASIDYRRACRHKAPLLRAAWQRFRNRPLPTDYHAFLHEHRYWLDDYVLFIALREHHKRKPWTHWPAPLRSRRPRALAAAARDLDESLDYHRFLQCCFYRQYLSLKQYANDRDVQIFGDLPIYVARDSADVWAHPEIFKLTAAGRLTAQAGVPPDYFSETGQLWGNPVYDWKTLQATGYDWWLRRLHHNFRLYDAARIDHFRGLVAYWEVPASHKTAVRGRWIDVPHRDFFNAVFRTFPAAPLVAEDLGYITADVREVIDRLDLPCMKVLQFAFDDNPLDNPHYPCNYLPNSIVYTGTHDNNTTRGWFQRETSPAQRRRLRAWLGHNPAPATIAWDLIRTAWTSTANLAIAPAQDLLALGHHARMNTPATSKDNWRWRLKPNQLTPTLAHQLHDLTQLTARA